MSVKGAASGAANEVPEALMDRLASSQLSRQRGFNYFDWGGALVFRQVPTFIDGRLEPFAAAGVFREYLEIEQSGDVERLEQKDVRWILTRAGLPVAERLRSRPGWKLADTDEGAMGAELWVREEGPQP